MPANGRWDLTLILLTWRIWWSTNNASKWQMGFNSAFKGLKWKKFTFFLHSVCRCSVWLPERTAITSINRAKDLFFVIAKQHFWEIRITVYSFLRQVHIHFQCVFSTQRDLVLPPSISNLFSFPSGHSVSTYVSFLVFSSIVAFLQ